MTVMVNYNYYTEDPIIMCKYKIYVDVCKNKVY